MKDATAATGYTLFGTAIGAVGIAWSSRGVVATHLPEATPARTEAALAERAPGAVRSDPPSTIKEAIGLIGRHLGGEVDDLKSIRLDCSAATPFRRAVYEATRDIPPGQTRSYGEVAERAGSPGASRAVGSTMATNPLPLIIPCHRVIASGGGPGGFMAAGGLTTKSLLLAIEGVNLRLPKEEPSLFAGDGTLPFDGEEAVAHLSKVDPVLRKHIERIGPLKLQRKQMHGTYEALAESIIYQQLNGKAAATIAARVKAAFGRDTYPPPAVFLAAPEEKLRDAGLSRNKLASIRDLAGRTMAGEVPPLHELDTLSDDEIVERLTVVRGIGRWTVEMLLIFRLGRSDVLPVDDFGVRKGFGRLFLKGAMATAEQLNARGERWRPFRSAASWYLWRAAEL